MGPGHPLGGAGPIKALTVAALFKLLTAVAKLLLRHGLGGDAWSRTAYTRLLYRACNKGRDVDMLALRAKYPDSRLIVGQID